MPELFRKSVTWAIDFRYDGHPRRWFKICREGIDPTEAVRGQLRSLYGERATWVSARLASPDEETQYLRGEVPRNPSCPTGRHTA